MRSHISTALTIKYFLIVSSLYMTSHIIITIYLMYWQGPQTQPM